MSHSSGFLGETKRVKIKPLEKEDSNALDNLRGFARVVGPRTRDFLHHGWVHPHPSRIGRRCCPDSCYSGPQSDRLIAEIIR